MKVFIAPRFKGNEYGGIPRVVEAQRQYLPLYDCEVVDDPSVADVLAMHATAWIEPQGNQRIVSHCHGLYWNDYQWPRWAHAVNREVAECIRKADAVTAPSEWVANALRRGTDKPITCIGHGVALDEWELTKHNNYILWDKTRADPVCDPRCVNVLANLMPNIRFATSIGDEAPNVEVIGIQPYSDHKDWIRHATLYLCTARETFGIGTIEALACGVPVVGWDWGGQQDIVTGDVGKLVPLGDYAALKQAILECIDNRERLSHNARLLVESKYQWKDVVSQYADLYRQTIDANFYEAKVSVIIPSYNLKDYLPRAIESVLAQDTDDYELIIVDDCSTDGSLELAQELTKAHENCYVVRTPTNLYLAGALNYGISKATGEFILPLDADNTIEPNTLSVLSNELSKTREFDIVYGKVKFINEDGTPYRSTITDESGVSRWPPDVFNYEQQMAHRNQIPSTSMYRRSIWSNIGGYRRRCRTAEDADFWCRATTYGARPYKVTDAITLIYTNRNESMSHKEVDWPWEEWYSDNRPTLSINPPIPNPTISVIIPVGPGHGEWVTDALDSLANQTMKDWECIIVDDAHDIRWLPSWVRVFKTQRAGSGTSVARNIGLEQIRGSCFLFLDADDYLESNALEIMYQAQRQYGGYVYSDFYKPDDMTHVQIQGDCLTLKHNLIHPITCLFPSDINVRFDESMAYGEDWDYILACVDKGWCGTHVQKPLLYYRQSDGHNRRALIDNIDTVRSKMQEKYTVGCGCGNGGGQVVSSPVGVPMGHTSNDLVLIEYTKADQATITYRGPNTGTEYRFGGGEGHKLGYVHTSDLEWFLARLEFRLADLATV